MSEKKKRSRFEKMYGDSPKMERDEEGKMDVKKKPEHKDEVKSGTEGVVRGGVPVHARHAVERADMHHRHMHEHHAHDHGDHGDKKEMHSRHEKEHRALHTRHEHEMAEGSEDTEDTGEEMIKKVETDKKEKE